jgi:hypothetical protein
MNYHRMIRDEEMTLDPVSLPHNRLILRNVLIMTKFSKISSEMVLRKASPSGFLSRGTHILPAHIFCLAPDSPN